VSNYCGTELALVMPNKKAILHESPSAFAFGAGGPPARWRLPRLNSEVGRVIKLLAVQQMLDYAFVQRM
jgi:hypothetical protein